MGLYFKVREKVRFNPFFHRIFGTLDSLRYSKGSALSRLIERRAQLVPGPGKGVALCVRIKDEAAVLSEWLEYYRAAGVDHVYIYESFSSDNFREVLRPYIEEEFVTLMADWPYVPVTPYAEEDCILRAVNRFAWVGFLDADEFLVIEDGSGIEEFLSRFGDTPAVGFHWYYFGSSGYKQKPSGPIIRSYTKREAKPNRHIKVFVRPNQVTHCRNPHSWHYKRMRHAITEAGDPAYGSFSLKGAVRSAWIGHFHCKSEEEYIAKMEKKELCDTAAMKFPQRRTRERLRQNLQRWNQVEDLAVQQYYRKRCESMRTPPVLLDV